MQVAPARTVGKSEDFYAFRFLSNTTALFLLETSAEFEGRNVFRLAATISENSANAVDVP